MANKNARIKSPVNGDFMYPPDGVVQDGKLVVPVIIEGEGGFKVNGMNVQTENGVLKADIPLEDGENKILLSSEDGSVLDEITLFQASKSYKTYRFSLDDNIWWLKDLAENAGTYQSMFDNPFLGFFKKLHDAFGTKVHFNLYYQDVDSDFNLSMMPDVYKKEFMACSDWIVLTFHAYANDPDKPYIDTTYEKIYADCRLITNEIIRFAGEQVLSDYTTIHWGEANREGCRAMKDCGFNGLVGYFEMENGKPSVSYYLDAEQTQHLSGRDIWRDTDFGMTFIKHDMVVNLFDAKDVVPYLEKLLENPHESGFIELMIHEQYYYPHYTAYQPDWEEKVWESVRYVTEKGYKPVFLKEVLK